MKQASLAVIAVFITWIVLDFLVHGVLLASSYQDSAELWRSPDDMKLGLLYLVTLVAAICFVSVYAWLIQPKSLAVGLAYGLITGLGGGLAAGIGSYAVMPITTTLAAGWLAEYLFEAAVAGLLVGSIVSSHPSRGEPA